MRRHPFSPVDQGADGCGKLDGSNLKRLPKTHGCQLHKPYRILFMHNGSCLPRQIYAGQLHHPKLPEVFKKTIRPKS